MNFISLSRRLPASRQLLAIALLFMLPSMCFSGTIIVDKQKLRLYVVEKNDTVFRAPISAGINRGNKTRPGDHKTPEGTFTIWMIQNSSTWTHDFGDGKGKRKGAYGPWFFRLKVPNNTHIGIHGTCFPESIGKRSSEGCIRLRNEDITRLRAFVTQGMKVIILPDKK